MFVNGVVGDCHWLAFCVSHLLCVVPILPLLSVLRRLTGLVAAWGRTHTPKGHKSWTLVLGLFVQCRLAGNEPVVGTLTQTGGRLVHPGCRVGVQGWGVE